MQTRIVLPLFLMLLAAASTARAGMIFNDDITGECLAFAGGTGSNPLSSDVVNQGRGATLWGDCGFTSTATGSSGLQFSWNGSLAAGSSLDGEAFPFHYDFSAAGPSDAVLHWAIMIEILGLHHASPEYVLGQGVTAPGGGSVSYSGSFLTASMTPTIWMIDFAVWFDTHSGDTLTVTVPERSSIDLNSTPEPSGVLPMLTGLPVMVFLARRRRLPR